MLTIEQRHLILFAKDGYGNYADNPLTRIRPIAARHYDLRLDQTSDMTVVSMVLDVYNALHEHQIINRPYYLTLQAYITDLTDQPNASPKELILNRMLNEIRYIKRDDYNELFTLPQPNQDITNDIEKLTNKQTEGLEHNENNIE